MSIKFLVLGGGVFWVWGGGSADFDFYGRGDFSELKGARFLLHGLRFPLRGHRFPYRPSLPLTGALSKIFRIVGHSSGFNCIGSRGASKNRGLSEPSNRHLKQQQP